MPAVVIRPAQKADAAAIAALLPDLGYPTTTEDVTRRLSRLDEWPDNSIAVAEVCKDLVGLCHVQGFPLLAIDAYAEVQALVVANSSRRAGIGSALLHSAIKWSAAHGYFRIRLQSGPHRQVAHLFYEAQGFTRSKLSYVFELEVPPL